MNDDPASPSTQAASAVIADDERLLREQLRARLADAWPALRIGDEAVELTATHRPDVVFLDIRMPGTGGIEAAQRILRLDVATGAAPPLLVFITAYDQHAVQAFEAGAIDYVLKPAEPARLAATVQRLQQRLAERAAPASAPAARASITLDSLHSLLQQLTPQPSRAAPLQWLQASVGSAIQLIAVDEVLFFISDEKYTRVQTATQEALIRTPIKELAEQLDAQRFWQIHRSTLVNVQAIAAVQRDERGRLLVSLRQHPQRLEVSRSYAARFKGM